MLTAVVIALVKTGLAALSPAIGEVGVAALAESTGLAGELLGEHRAIVGGGREAAARRLASRTFALLGELPEEASRRLPGEAVAILGGYGLNDAEWVDAGYSPQIAARRVMARAAPLVGTPDDDDRANLARLVEAFYAALSEEPRMLGETEAAFRTSVLARLDQAICQGAALADGSRQMRCALAASLLRLPGRSWSCRLSPAHMLRADYEVVPFHGRRDDIDDIRRWCEDPAAETVRLYTAPGGSGKTRLFIEAVRRQRSDCVFRRKPAGYSDANQPPIPSEASRGFR